MYWELHAVQCPAALLQQPRHWWRRGGSREHHTDPEEHPAKPNTNATQGIIASTGNRIPSHTSPRTVAEASFTFLASTWSARSSFARRAKRSLSAATSPCVAASPPFRSKDSSLSNTAGALCHHTRTSTHATSTCDAPPDSAAWAVAQQDVHLCRMAGFQSPQPRS